MSIMPKSTEVKVVGIKDRKEQIKKYQYTKPFKDRDRSKDIGINKPLKKSNRLKFPEKPHYYTLHTTPKLAVDHPFYNIRNKYIAQQKNDSLKVFERKTHKDSPGNNPNK